MKPRVYAVCLLVSFLLATSAWAQQSAGGPIVSDGAAAPAKKKDPSAKPAPATDSAMVGEMRPSQGVPSGAASQAPRRNEAPAAEPGQIQMELRYNVDGTSIQGNRDRSFLWPGINHTAETNFLMTHPVGSNWKMETVGDFRYTDNPRVDPLRSSIQKFYMRLGGPSFESTVGDALVNYSRLSFNQNIKGLNIWKDFARNFRLTGTAGYFVDRWGTLYRPFDYFRNVQVDCQADSVIGNPGIPIPSQPAPGCVETAPFSNTFLLNPTSPSKPYSRLIAGVRGEQKIGRNGWVAANWSRGDDMLQTLPSARVLCDSGGVLRVADIYPGCNQTGETEVQGRRLPSPESVLNDVFSVDSNYEIEPWKLRMSGEVAFSWTAGGAPPAGATATTFFCSTQSPVVGAAVLDSRCFSDRVLDRAYRFEATQRLKKFNWRADFSRFGPNFFSANARQIRDLQDFSVRGEYEVIRPITFVAGFRRTSDNLNSQRNFTNVIRNPEIRLIFRDLPFYRRMSLEVGYRERNLETTGNPQVTCSAPNPTPPPPSISVTYPARQGCQPGETFINTEARKRSTRIPFFSLSFPAGDNLFSFDFEHRHDMDAVRAAQATDTDRFAFGYRGNYTWSQWDVSPSLRFEIERLDKSVPNDPTRALNDSALLFPIDFFNAFDTNRSIVASLMLEAPRYFRFEGVYREFNSVILSPVDPANPALSLLYLNQGFKRPNWRASLTYKVANDENKTLTFFYERTNNFFDTGDPLLIDKKSFRETVIGGTVLWRFRR